MEKIEYALRKACIAVIKFYRAWISPLFGSVCRFHPSCSQYAIDAIQQYGVLYGSGKTFKRLCRCHPWHPGGDDPVK